jgi:hypothetical protein
MEAVSDVKQRDADFAGSGLPQTFDEVVDHLDLSRTTWVTHQCWAQKIGVPPADRGIPNRCPLGKGISSPYP